MKVLRNTVAIALVAGLLGVAAQPSYAIKETRGLKNLAKQGLAKLGEEVPVTRWEKICHLTITTAIGICLLISSVTLKHEQLSTMIEKDIDAVQGAAAVVEKDIDAVQEAIEAVQEASANLEEQLDPIDDKRITAIEWDGKAYTMVSIAINGKIPTMGLEGEGRELSIPVGYILNNRAVAYALKDAGAKQVDHYEGDDGDAVFFSVDQAYRHHNPETENINFELKAGQVLSAKTMGEIVYRTGYVTLVTQEQADAEGKVHDVYYFVHKDNLKLSAQ